MEVENAVRSEISSSHQEKKKRKRQGTDRNVEANHDCPEGASLVKDTSLEPPVKLCSDAEAITLEPPANATSEKKSKKKRRKTDDDFCWNAVSAKAEDTTLEPWANFASENKKKKKKRKTSDVVVDNGSTILDYSATVEDTLQAPPVDISMVPKDVEATRLEPQASVTSEKKKKKKKSKTTEMHTMDHESALGKGTLHEPPVNTDTVAVFTKVDAATLDPTSVTPEKRKKKKRSKISDDYRMNAIDHESGSFVNSASVKDTPLEPPINSCTIRSPAEAGEATTLEPPANVTSEKKKKKKKIKAVSDSKVDDVDHDSAPLENTASAEDSPVPPLVNLPVIAVPTKVEAVRTLDPVSNVTSEKKKKKKKGKAVNDSKLDAVDHYSARLENTASVEDSPVAPLVNLPVIAVPTEVEAERTLDPVSNVTSEKKKKKKKSKAGSDSKLDAVDHESAPLENTASVKDTPVAPFSLPMIAVPAGLATVTTLDPLVNVTSEKKKRKKIKAGSDPKLDSVPKEEEAKKPEPPTHLASEKKKKKKSKTSDDPKMNGVDHESASLENNASAKDTPMVSLVNLSMIAVPTKAEEAMASEPQASEKKKKKKKSKTSDNSKMNAIDHESASFENSALAKDTPEVPLVNLSMIASEAEVTWLEPPPNVASEKKKKKKRKTGEDSKTNGRNYESASVDDSASQRHLHPRSVVGIDTVTNSEMCPLSKEVVMASEKKKRKRSRSKDPTISNIDNENLNGATLEPTALGREQQSLVIPGQISDEQTTNLEKPTPNSDLGYSKEKTKKRNREKRIRKQKNKQAMRQNVHENNGKVLDGTVQSSHKSSVGIEPELEPQCAQSSLSHEMGVEKDQNKITTSDIDVIDHTLQQNVVLPGEGDFVSEVAELNLTGLKGKSPTSEEWSGLTNGVTDGLTEKCGGHTEFCDVTYKRRKKNYDIGVRKSSDMGDTKQRVEDKDDNDTSSPWLAEENIYGSLDGKVEKNSSALDVVLEQVADIQIERDSVSILENEPESGERENSMNVSDFRETSSRSNVLNNSTKVHVSEGICEQKNGRMLVARQDAFKDGTSSCKENVCGDISNLVAIKMETSKEGAPSSSNHGEIDLAGLDAICKEENVPQMHNPLPERSLVARSKKKLLILDVNGILVEFVPNCRCQPDIRISKKGVFKRPYCDDFLQFCFDRFNVGVWSSRMKFNVDKVVNFLFGQTKHKLLFCWDQSHCTPTGLNTIENKAKPLVLKELRKVWEKVEPDLPFEKGEYDETNTLLLDDSPYKALRNPANTAVFPFPYRFGNRHDNSLGPGGDLRTYLEGLSMADNVKEYLEQNPFGQGAITESHMQWDFYSKIVGAGELVSKL